jgi:hypothetical protein
MPVGEGLGDRQLAAEHLDGMRRISFSFQQKTKTVRGHCDASLVVRLVRRFG